MFLRIKITCLFFVMALCGLHRANGSDVLTVPVFSAEKGGSPVSEWLLLGPIPIKESSAIEGCSNVKDFIGFFENAIRGDNENFVGEKRFAVQEPCLAKNAFSPVDFHKSLGVQSDMLDRRIEYAYYASCIIKSDRSKLGYFFSKSQGSLSIWINGKLTDGLGNNITGTLELEQGENFVLVRVSRRGPTSFSLYYSPEFESALSVAANFTPRFLPRSVYAPGEVPILSLSIKSASASIFEIDVMDTAGKVLHKGLRLCNPGVIPQAANLPSGLYKLTIKCGGCVREEMFFWGDPEKKFAELASRAKLFSTQERAYINLRALLRRCDILLDKENGENVGDAWRDKLCATLFDLEESLALLEAGREGYRDVVGLHIRGFQSRIDRIEQHYRLFIPTTYRRGVGGLPLLLIYPTVPSVSRPFLESPFMADHEGAMKMAALAEQLNAGLLWIGYRGAPVGSPADFTHLDEVIAEVVRDYDIDEHRMVLLATCGGGITAGMSAVEFPARFAGLGVYDGIFRRSRHRPGGNTLFYYNQSYNNWIAETDWFSRQFSIKDFPVYVIADYLKNEGQGEISLSIEYVNAARAAGANVLFEEASRYEQVAVDPWERLLKWAVKQYRVNANAARTSGVLDNYRGPGPVSRAFAAPFLLVRATGGTPREREEAEVWAKIFVSSWSRVHYGECPVKNDCDVTEADEGLYNLVLLGNSQINSVWKKYVKQEDFDLKENSIVVKGRRYWGFDLSGHAVLPHPRRASGQMVLIGAYNLTRARPDIMEMSLDGWYDYSIWQPEFKFGRVAPFARLIDAGFYEDWLANTSALSRK
jgi:hypothetical protein